MLSSLHCGSQKRVFLVNNDQLRRQAQAIVQRPYLKVIQGEGSEGFLSEAPELPGCFTAGETEAEALANLREAMTAWVMTALDDGDLIPEPACGNDAGACLVIRVPEQVSKRLSERARAEGISSGQLAANLLSQALLTATS